MCVKLRIGGNFITAVNNELLKRNFNAGVKQIARVTRLDPDMVAKIV